MTIDKAAVPADPHAIIGQAVARHAPAGWRRAWISGEAQDDYVRQVASYADEHDREHPLAIPASTDVATIADALLDMRERLRRAGEAPFGGYTFTVFADGCFTLDLTYDA